MRKGAPESTDIVESTDTESPVIYFNSFIALTIPLPTS